MALKYEVVVFSDDWYGLPFSCKHLLKHFLPDVPLIWVETIGLRSPKLNIYDIKRSFTKIAGWLKSDNSEKQALPDNLSILDPMQIPYNQIKAVRQYNMSTMIKAVGKPKDGYKRVLLTTWPFLGDLIGNLDEDLSIYYRVDDFSEFPGVNKKLICELENDIINKADILLASAEKLMQVKKAKEQIKYMPHGVDYEHFSKRLTRNREYTHLNQFTGPKIGFFGLLNSWLDFELMQKIALNNPQWSVVIIGPSQLAESELPKAANLHYLGPIAYDKLPEYASQFDVGLIPFKINDLTLAVNPLKLMEYFALGIPVLSTPLPEVAKYGDQVKIAQNANEAGKAIDEILSSESEAKRQARMELAQERSWQSKSQQLKEWIETALNK